MISTIDVALRIFVAMLLSGIIGFERERKNKPAGIRTHVIVGLGATLYTLTAYFSKPDEIARIIANLITGIGFIGAGTIMKTRDGVIGLTTAATLWITVAIGILVGVGAYFPAVLATLASYFVLRFIKGS